ncbi:L-lysine 2,3-aminomutase [Fontimonas thermophila]|uniref:L-lysine 2,3-aminomutase n=1 Tax=Fontimonas thermophila TaxID=1076937 RepID=A0A1I2IME9_9GAMM|nr:EF-P beta-lysylation protein EpmB [Fontimonas thermophila]SFF42860.1 L-lysine 2,3-aminomutase [Fontimonas thermophila]
MIPSPTTPRQQAPAWQHALREAFTRPDELLRFLELDPDLPALGPARLRAFPLRVPRGFARRMRKGDAQDPLFRQVWPATAEGVSASGFTVDAVGDLRKLRSGGIIHKYHGRALLVATGACAIHCRYCFRRHFPYGEHLAAREHWQAALETIAADSSLHEIILSGGDPLSLSDDKLAELADALEAIPHVRRLRVHTRQPIVLPERIDERLLAWLGRGRLTKLMVLHVNHANEIDASVVTALQPLRALGIPLLNQSVLLRGVNDSVDALAQLSERLFECGILPYYLHLLDRVQGAAHFEVEESRARALMRGLAARLPGYLVPRLVREEPGATAKTSIAW